MLLPQELFASVHPQRILDAATGGGGFIQCLLEGLSEYDEIIGIDNNPRSAEAFAKTFPDQPKIRFLPMDVQQMTFADASFDLVCIANSLHHLPDPQTALREMRRVLRPGGHLLVMEMICDGQSEPQLTHVLLHHWWAAVDRRLGVSHNQTLTRAELTDLLQGLGLEPPQVYEVNEDQEDALNTEALAEIESIIERYLQRADGSPELQAEGEALRQRLRAVGILGATELVWLGAKPPRVDNQPPPAGR